MRFDEWDLPSDAAMISWVEQNQAIVHRSRVNGEWKVSIPDDKQGDDLRTIMYGREGFSGPTWRAAVENAMKELPL